MTESNLQVGELYYVNYSTRHCAGPADFAGRRVIADSIPDDDGMVYVSHMLRDKVHISQLSEL